MFGPALYTLLITHFEHGKTVMVDVSEKTDSVREATG